MHSAVPQRRIKNRIRLGVLLFTIFTATITLCVVCLLLASSIRQPLISPLAKFVRQINTDSQIDAVKQFCKKDNLSCKQITAQPDDSIQIVLDSGTVVFLSTQKDISGQLASLQKVASQLTIKGKQLKRVDFRFAQVVVSF